jgi:hypothetical protein
MSFGCIEKREKGIDRGSKALGKSFLYGYIGFVSFFEDFREPKNSTLNLELNSFPLKRLCDSN